MREDQAKKYDDIQTAQRKAELLLLPALRGQMGEDQPDRRLRIDGSNMADIIDWLAGVEEMASILYSEAANAFEEDKAFSNFLSLLAQEESEHLLLLKRVSENSLQPSMSETCFTFDETVRSNVEAPFVRAGRLLETGELSKAAMVRFIAEAEFSEWNEIFLYTINAIKELDREFQKAVAEIERHRADIEKFIISFPEGHNILERFGRLRSVWKRRILIVEDDPAIANLLKGILVAEAEVIVAKNGEEGLARILEAHFDVIVSDVEMPKLDGIQLYKYALNIDPGLHKHFVFFSGTMKPEHRSFLESSKVVILPKPSPVSRLRQVINRVAAGNERLERQAH